MHPLANSTSVYDFQPAGIRPVSQDLESLFENQPIERFDPGETVFFQGDPAKYLYEITEGVARLCKILVDGRRIVTGFLFAGDMIGISQLQKYACSAEAVTSLKVRCIARKRLDDAIDHSPGLRPQVFAKLCDEMAAAEEQMVLLSCKTAQERLCCFLAYLMKRAHSSHKECATIDLPMTRLDIGDYLGLSIETVSRNLTKLAKRGVIGEVERVSLRILKPQMLQKLGGIWDDYEDYGSGPSLHGSNVSYGH